jgi:hypothetical protein
VEIRVSAVRGDWAEAGRLRVGDAYTRGVAEGLGAGGLDAFGEGGEFHTEVLFPDPAKPRRPSPARRTSPQRRT